MPQRLIYAISDEYSIIEFMPIPPNQLSLRMDQD